VTWRLAIRLPIRTGLWDWPFACGGIRRTRRTPPAPRRARQLKNPAGKILESPTPNRSRLLLAGQGRPAPAVFGALTAVVLE